MALSNKWRPKHPVRWVHVNWPCEHSTYNPRPVRISDAEADRPLTSTTSGSVTDRVDAAGMLFSRVLVGDVRAAATWTSGQGRDGVTRL